MLRIREFNFQCALMMSLMAILIGAQAQQSASAAESVKMKFFGDKYNPKITRMEAIEYGKKYEGEPKKIKPLNTMTDIQPWSGYCPESKRKEAKNLPCQTFNIKAGGIYRGIQVGSNKWMKMACDVARISVENGGGPFGAVILQIDDKTGKVIRYWKNNNHVAEWIDPTAHAEVTTIRAACKNLGVFNLGKIEKSNPNLKLSQTGKTSHCVIYSSAEPCPMCYAAIRWARIDTLVFAATRFDAATQGCGFSDEPIYVELATPMVDRKELGMNVYQSTSPNSLDAFNGYKRLDSIKY